MGAHLSTTDMACGVVSLVVAVQMLTPANPIGSTLRMFRQFRLQEKGLTSSTNVSTSIDEYNRLHQSEDASERNREYKSLVNAYYDLATLFYEWGWGQSFHFANRNPNERFDDSIRRHEYQLASRLGLSGNPKNIKLLDVGCGIGGPMRNICKFTGADVTGLTLNQYQVDRGNELCRADSQLHNTEKSSSSSSSSSSLTKCRSVQGDFMKMPFKDSTFDGAYAIEATCHAPDRVGVYSEIYRVLKPGSVFACYEWCMTDRYDPSNADHRLIKKQIEEGDGLPDICRTQVCLDALEEAGFEVLDQRDVARDDYGANCGGKRWNLPLLPSWNPLTQRFQFNWFGKALTKNALKVLEFLRLAPKGTSKTQIMLQQGGIGCANGGETGIFTPMYLMVGRVPLEAENVVSSSKVSTSVEQ